MSEFWVNLKATYAAMFDSYKKTTAKLILRKVRKMGVAYGDQSLVAPNFWSKQRDLTNKKFLYQLFPKRSHQCPIETSLIYQTTLLSISISQHRKKTAIFLLFFNEKLSFRNYRVSFIMADAILVNITILSFFLVFCLFSFI